MANNYVTITLDTTAPANPSVLIDGGSQYATDTLVDLTIGTDDVNTTEYQMKIWGSVDTTFDVNVQGTEEASSWITYTTGKQIRISEVEEQKTISIKIRDEVFNESAIVSDTIIYDATKPQVTVNAPDKPKISKITGRNVSNFSFTADVPFEEYLVKVVNSAGATNDLGTQILTTNGSVNTGGTGTFDTSTAPIQVTINGTDLEVANGGSGDNIVIKVFVRDVAGNWSA